MSNKRNFSLSDFFRVNWYCSVSSFWTICSVIDLTSFRIQCGGCNIHFFFWLRPSLLKTAQVFTSSYPLPPISSRVNFAAPTEDETVLAGSMAAATLEENATEEIIQSSQVRSGSSMILSLHAGFARLHSGPCSAISVQWTWDCRGARGRLPCRRLPCIWWSYSAKVFRILRKFIVYNS